MFRSRLRNFIKIVRPRNLAEQKLRLHFSKVTQII